MTPSMIMKEPTAGRREPGERSSSPTSWHAAIMLVAALAGGCSSVPTGDRNVTPPEILIDASGIPVAISPGAMLRAGAAREIDVRLAEQGLLEAGQVNDQLDDATQQGLQRAQRRAGLPATGMPSYATVEALGLSPEDVFQTSDSVKPQSNDHPANASFP